MGLNGPDPEDRSRLPLPRPAVAAWVSSFLLAYGFVGSGAPQNVAEPHPGPPAPCLTSTCPLRSRIGPLRMFPWTTDHVAPVLHLTTRSPQRAPMQASAHPEPSELSPGQALHSWSRCSLDCPFFRRPLCPEPCSVGSPHPRVWAPVPVAVPPPPGAPGLPSLPHLCLPKVAHLGGGIAQGSSMWDPPPATCASDRTPALSVPCMSKLSQGHGRTLSGLTGGCGGARGPGTTGGLHTRCTHSGASGGLWHGGDAELQEGSWADVSGVVPLCGRALGKMTSGPLYLYPPTVVPGDPHDQCLLRSVRLGTNVDPCPVPYLRDKQKCRLV